MPSHPAPTVSVLLPAYNAMPHLPQAVESILRQSCRDIELIVVNDGSRDGTAAYLDGLQDHRVRVIHQENRGLSSALNRGLEDCRAEFTARMDADDVAFPSRLDEQLVYLREHPPVGLLGTQIQPLGTQRAGKRSHLPLNMRDIQQALLDGRHAICHPTVMFRTQLVQELGGYWSEQLGEEWDLFLRIGEQAELANLDRVLLSYRVHSSSLNGTRLVEMHQHFAYAVECSHRRRLDRPPVSYEEFTASHQTRPVWQRWAGQLDMLALGQYKRAQTEILGQQPWRGYARLAAAAACSPRLTTHRVLRVTRVMLGKFSRRDTMA